MNIGTKIGIYGGAFDPPHLAHVALAEAAVRQFQLDQLLVIPTGDAVHKRRHLTASHHRVAMAKLAFAQIPAVQVDTREIDRGGATYTFDTLIELRAAYPEAHFTLFIGQDQLTSFHTWKNYQEILKEVSLAVALRGQAGDSIMAVPEITYAPIDFVPQSISSSDIRQMIRLKDDQFKTKMSASVADYIQAQALYNL